MANILGTGLNDFLLGDVDPLLPNDVLNSSFLAGDDTMVGGNGDDTYNVNSVGDIVTEGNGASSGTDTVVSQVVSYTLGSNVEKLVLQENDRTGTIVGGIPVVLISLGAPTALNGTGNTLDNTITGNSNGNVLSGLAGADTLLGGDGSDWLFGGTEGDTLNGEVGNDFLYGDAGTDTLDGGNDNDYLSGGTENDTLIGGSGADTLNGGSGSDTMSGGTGNDVFVVDAAGDSVSENAASGTDTVQSSITYTLTDVDLENLTLTGAANINGTGNAGANVLTGNTGANVLDGLGGADTMAGGAGNDTYVVDSALDSVSENAAAGTDLVKSSVTYTLTDVDLENLTLTGAAAINGTGNLANNLINGNSSGNTLKGLVGNDTIFGSGGDDTVEGGIGLDQLHGGVGIDVLRAQTAAGDDGVTDRFYFDTALNAATNWDQIDLATFNTADAVDDEFYLKSTIFTGLTVTAGSLNEYYEGGGTTGGLVTDDVGIYLDTASGQLYYNPTLGVANDNVLFAVVDNAIAGGSASVSASDFTLF